MIADKQPVKINAPPIWTRKKTLPPVTESWHNYMCRSTVEDFQHTVLQVSPVTYDESVLSTATACHYEFPNGYNQVIFLFHYFVSNIVNRNYDRIYPHSKSR